MMLDNFDNIQVPETVRHMTEIDPKIRHVRKLALFIGIPLLILIIIVAVYFGTLRSRQSASKQVDNNTTNTENKGPDLNASGIVPASNLSDLPGALSALPDYKTKFESIKLSVSKYDQIFKDVKLKGQCYSNIADGVASHDAWSNELKSLITQNIPEISTLPDDSNKDLIDKYNQFKADYKNYNSEIKVFIDSEQIVYQSWLDTNKTLFKICDSTVDQIVDSCKPIGGVIDNYKKLLIKENNQDLFASLDGINDYCKQIADVIKNDNSDKFVELNNKFGENYSKILSNYPNIADKATNIKNLQTKIENSITILSQ